MFSDNLILLACPRPQRHCLHHRIQNQRVELARTDDPVFGPTTSHHDTVESPARVTPLRPPARQCGVNAKNAGESRQRQRQANAQRVRECTHHCDVHVVLTTHKKMTQENCG